jgi:hypothetical protein
LVIAPKRRYDRTVDVIRGRDGGVVVNDVALTAVEGTLLLAELARALGYEEIRHAAATELEHLDPSQPPHESVAEQAQHEHRLDT